jgi:hypothetical protein
LRRWEGGEKIEGGKKIEVEKVRRRKVRGALRLLNTFPSIIRCEIPLVWRGGTFHFRSGLAVIED